MTPNDSPQRNNFPRLIRPLAIGVLVLLLVLCFWILYQRGKDQGNISKQLRGEMVTTFFQNLETKKFGEAYKATKANINQEEFSAKMHGVLFGKNYSRLAASTVGLGSASQGPLLAGAALFPDRPDLQIALRHKQSKINVKKPIRQWEMQYKIIDTAYNNPQNDSINPCLIVNIRQDGAPNPWFVTWIAYESANKEKRITIFDSGIR